MTVELGRFGVLQTGLSHEQVAVLVDSEEDWVEGRAQSGLILHSPRLVELRLEELGQQQSQMPEFRLDEKRVELLRQLRTLELQREKAREDLEWEKRLTVQEEPLPGSLDRSYRDPVGGSYSGRWLAAFEPVIVKGRPESIRDTGWVVIVQERYDATSPAAAER